MRALRWRWVLLGTGLAVFVLVGAACTPPATDDANDPAGDDANSPPASLAEILGVDAANVDQAFVDDVTTRLATLAETDTAVQAILQADGIDAARDQLLTLLGEQADIAQVIATAAGVSIEYTDGLRAEIVLDQGDQDPNIQEAATARGLQPAMPIGKDLAGRAKVKPNSKKTVYLCPHYWEREPWADDVIATANARFDACQLDRFTVYTGEQCTMSRFLKLGDYGVVHIHSHGTPWPSEKNVEKVYLMTGEIADPLTIGLLKLAGMIPDEVMVSRCEYLEPGRREILIKLSAAGFKRGNNFTTSRPLVWLGFCYSGQGGWPDAVSLDCGALAVLSFNDAIDAGKNTDWAKSMYNMLGDTTYWAPVEVGFWFDNTDHDYWTPIDPNAADPDFKKVTLQLTGVRSTVLWEELQPALIADNCLERAVRNVLNKPDGELTTADLEQVTYINARNVGISSLAGLEACKNLDYLNLGSNEIEDLSPLVGLTKLTGLILDDNNITNISPLAGLTTLVNLDLARNHVTSVTPIAGLTKLAELRLHWQRNRELASAVGVESMTELTWLSVDGNSLTSLGPVSGLTKLQTLNAGYNEIASVADVTALASLISLRLDENPITDIGPLQSAAFAGRYIYITLNCCDLDENCDPAQGDTADCQVVEALEAGGAFVSWGDRDFCGTDPPLSWPVPKETCAP